MRYLALLQGHKVAPQKPCPSVRSVQMVNQLSIGKSKLSVGTDGEMNTRSVNVQNPFVNEVVSIIARA